jgi:paraquat-inducible protein A
MKLRNISAFVLTAASLVILYPGLTVPILQISIAPELPLLGKTTFYEQTQSILQTVETLYKTKNELVAFLILLFSVIIPVTKGVIILTLLILKESVLRTNLYKFVFAIGKWSMADVFVVGIFIAFLSTQSNNAIDAVLLDGFNYFVAYCIISLVGIQLVKLDN